jgi:hypothetical protein
MTAIAAALPRLHTLGVDSLQAGVPAAAVAGFFEDLLPRLQLFEFAGQWPQNLASEDAAASSPAAAPLQLPHLRTLNLQGGIHTPPWTGFMGARPLELRADDLMIAHWLPPEDHRDGDVAIACPLSSVRTLRVVVRSRAVFTPTNVARLLRASPHLETLIISMWGVDVDESWPVHPAFDGLVHLKLKRVRIPGWSLTTPLTSDSFTRLRQRHFPRLKELGIDGREYFVTPPESRSFVKSLVARFMKFAAGLVS